MNNSANRLSGILGGAFLSLWFPTVALAEEGISAGDTSWVLTSTALVLFMTIPALALFYGGLVRTKNVLSILMQCLVLTALMSILWLGGAYSLSFAEGNAFFGSFSEKFFLRGIGPDAAWGSIPELVFFAFQMTFAVITPALIIGAFAERMRFSAMLLFSSLWLFLVYAPICHMTWGGGLFSQWGVFDFAGGIVVHITAGIAALVLCIVLGPREGYPRTPMPPHNLTMTFMGTAMLWVGWFGFNGGSALAADGNAAMAVVVTHISAAAATLAWMAIEWVKYGKPSVLGAATGAIAGLAAVTPASGYIGPFGGFAIGLISGGTCWFFATSLKNKLGYDDSLDVFGVHGVGGFVGTILVGVFASEIFGGLEGDLAMGSQVGTQLLAAVITCVYTAVATFVLIKFTALFVPIRVDANDELEGLDIALHEESGYNL
ncbi:MAG: ammonium transporter [Candidatus Binatia bacterium]|nr:ammonium transporter [Candidatus Binatia bacterium]MDG1959081.1 ammonium transporter [Candidatus Binatia bacterium]MDG2010935.1 ammonium transporter [Candidatus Binatia bacterium]HAC79490.1 ammonia channel protein [Deltaproteobacteria bacterium]